MVADRAQSRAESSDFTGPVGYFRGLAMVLGTAGVGTFVVNAIRWHPPPIYWLFALGWFLPYALIVLWLLRHTADRMIAMALTTPAEITPRSIAISIWPTALFIFAVVALLDLGEALWFPRGLGFTAIQMLTFAAVLLYGVRRIADHERSFGAQLLVRPRIGPNRSDFLLRQR